MTLYSWIHYQDYSTEEPHKKIVQITDHHEHSPQTCIYRIHTGPHMIITGITIRSLRKRLTQLVTPDYYISNNPHPQTVQ